MTLTASRTVTTTLQTSVKSSSALTSVAVQTSDTTPTSVPESQPSSTLSPTSGKVPQGNKNTNNVPLIIGLVIPILFIIILIILFMLFRRRRRAAHSNDGQENPEPIEPPSLTKRPWSAFMSRLSLIKSPVSSPDLSVSPKSPPAPEYVEKVEEAEVPELHSRELDRVPNLDSSPIHELAAIETLPAQSGDRVSESTPTRAQARRNNNDHVMSWASQGAESMNVGTIEGTLSP